MSLTFSSLTPSHAPFPTTLASMSLLAESQKGARYSTDWGGTDSFGKACAKPAFTRDEPVPFYKALKDHCRSFMDTDRYTNEEWQKIFNALKEPVPPKGTLGFWFKELCDHFLPEKFTAKQLSSFRAEYMKANTSDTSHVPFIASHDARDWTRAADSTGDWRRKEPLGAQAAFNCYAYAVGIPSTSEDSSKRFAGFNPGELSGKKGMRSRTVEELHTSLQADGSEALGIDNTWTTEKINAYFTALQQAGHTVFASYLEEGGRDYHFARFHSKGPYRWSHKQGISRPSVHDSRFEYKKTRQGHYNLLDGCFEFERVSYAMDESGRPVRQTFGSTIRPEEYSIKDPRRAVFLYNPTSRYLYQDCYVRPNPHAKESVASIQKRILNPSWFQCAAKGLREYLRA